MLRQTPERMKVVACVFASRMGRRIFLDRLMCYEHRLVLGVVGLHLFVLLAGMQPTLLYSFTYKHGQNHCSSYDASHLNCLEQHLELSDADVAFYTRTASSS